MLHDLLSLKSDGMGYLYWSEKVKEGFPFSAIFTMAKALDVKPSDITDLVSAKLPSSLDSLQKEKLDSKSSNKLLRIAMAYHRLWAILKNEEAVISWLRTPNKLLENCTPIVLLMSQTGASAVFAQVDKVVAPKSKLVTEDEESDRVHSVDDTDSEEDSAEDEVEIKY